MLANPLFKDLRSIFIYAFVWLFISGFYFSLIYWTLQIPLPVALPDSLTFNILLAGLGLSFWYPARFIYYDKEKFFRFIFTHLLGGILALGFWLLAGYTIVQMLVPDQQYYKEFFFTTLPWRILTGLLFYFLLITFYYLIIFYSDYQARMKNESELKALVTEAELRSLRFQINPHFIFNSLNSISSLTVTDPSKARSMILKLADFIRYTVSGGAGAMNPLRDELENIKLYLDIEKIRFEDKFDFIEDVSEECRNIPVPNMILQPLFENAIKHSVYEALGKTYIRLSCYPKNGFLNIEIDNNFELESSKKGAGVGLKNIDERLKLLYKRADLLKISKENGHFNVKLFIPAGEGILQ
jgi:two-component system, LytTR family, sensor kinase